MTAEPIVSPTIAWKLVLALALAGAILAAARARAPRRPTAGADLRCLVFAAVLLYAVGAGASLSHHGGLAAALYAGGVSAAALALWLSRGSGAGPPRGDEPTEERPPPWPEGLPRFDWAAFERELRAYSRRRERPRAPVASG
jgi:hypothetical protein